MIVEELVTKFKFSGNLSPLNNFNKGLSGSIFKLATFATAISATAIAFGKMAHNTLSITNNLVQLSRNTGVAVSDIQKLSFASSVSGSSIQAMESTIDSLTKKIGDASLRGSSDFQRLGISVRTSTGEVRKADDVLLDVANRFKALNLTLAQQKSLAGSLGIDASLIQLLSKSTDEIDRLSNRASRFGLLTKKNADQIASYNEQVAELKFSFMAFRQNLAVNSIPTMLKLFEVFKVLGEGIKRVAGFVVDFVKEFKLLAVAFGIGATAFAIMNSPVLIAIAGITALLAVTDDLIVAFKGGNSAIKDWTEPFFDLEKVLKKTVGYIKTIGKLRSGALSFVSDKIGNLLNIAYGQQSKGELINNYNMNQNNTINVNGRDADSIAEKTVDRLQEQLRNPNLIIRSGI